MVIIKKCAACGSFNTKKVEIVTRGAFTLTKEVKGIDLSPVSTKINKYVCLDCGYISLYAEDVSKFKD